ncbi:hypothetical protein DFH11DRAFT_1731469 [Phellopilus nigrolimitatus]|nr:hypothetical protein DFH11DRAFT_1731469 [Phellopilus nigrolimitatus]
MPKITKNAAHAQSRLDKEGIETKSEGVMKVPAGHHASQEKGKIVVHYAPIDTMTAARSLDEWMMLGEAEFIEKFYTYPLALISPMYLHNFVTIGIKDGDISDYAFGIWWNAEKDAHSKEYTPHFTADASTILSRASPLQQVPLDLVQTVLMAPAANAHFNYERLKTLGDAILKFITSVHLLAEHPHWPEGFLTKRKDHAVSNAYLAQDHVVETEPDLVDDNATTDAGEDLETIASEDDEPGEKKEPHTEKGSSTCSSVPHS